MTGSWRVMPGCQFRECLEGKTFLEVLAKHSAWRIFKCDFLIFHPYYIYPHYSQKYEKPFREKNPRQVFYNTQTHLLERESYSSLVRNHSSHFSFPLPLSYLERRFVPKHNPYLFRVQRVFWSLGSFGDLPKEVGEAWRMQLGVLRNPESQRRQGFIKLVGSRSLESSSTLGRLGLEGLLLFVYSNFILQWIDLPLGGWRRGFLPSSLVSFLITHWRVILCLYSSSLLF